MIKIDTSDKREQRKFGILIGCAFAVIGMVRWLLHWWRDGEMGPLPIYFLGIAVLIASLGLVAPKLLQPVFVAWIKLAIVLNFIMTHVLLTIAFVVAVVPIGLFMRVAGTDPLDRKFRTDASSYWKETDDSAKDKDHYSKQY